MLAAGRLDRKLRICRPPAKGVERVHVGPKDRRVFIKTNLHPPLEPMRSARVAHVLPELVKISIRPEDRSPRRVVSLKQPIAKRDPGLRVVDGRKKRRAADVPQ